MKSRRLKAHTIRQLEGSLFMAPWILGFLIFAAYPIVFSFVMSLFHVELRAGGLDMVWFGLENYHRILFENQNLLYNDLFPFLRKSLIMIPIIIVFSLMVSILLNQKFFGRTFFRSVFFIPVILSSGSVIQQLTFQGQGTLGFLEQLNITVVVDNYLPSSWSTPIISILESFVLVLWYSGVEILIFLAGRQTISASIYEAARIDGASPWESFWKITLPAMIPFILLNIIYCLVDLFTYPDNPLISRILTNQYDGYGINSAIIWIYFFIILMFLAVIFAVFSMVTRRYQPSVNK